MITLITATLPERASLFAQLAESVARQTLPPERWLIEWDYQRRGPVEILNELALQADTDWLFRVDDDDVLERDHFDILKPYLTDDADVVYTWCRAEGPLAENQFQKPFNADKLRVQNMIPSAACVRTSLWRQLDGYREDSYRRHEDWDFWLRAMKADARFVCVPIITWTYRLHGMEHRSYLP